MYTGEDGVTVDASNIPARIRVIRVRRTFSSPVASRGLSEIAAHGRRQGQLERFRPRAPAKAPPIFRSVEMYAEGDPGPPKLLINLAWDLKPGDVQMLPWAEALYKQRVASNGKGSPRRAVSAIRHARKGYSSRPI